jgi:hypothetical protein
MCHSTTFHEAMPNLNARSAMIGMVHRIIGGLAHPAVGANTVGRPLE